MTRKKFEILIVDDNRHLAQNMQDTFEAQEYNAAVAFDGHSAIELCRRKKFDLVLLDIHLPDMDGLMLQEQLSDLMQAEYLIITGHSSVDSAVRAVGKRQIIGYETKPVDLDRMLALIQQISERKQAEETLRESEEKYRSLVENIPDVTWTTDFEGKTNYISPNIEREYGYTPEEIYKGGDSVWLGRIHSEDFGKVEKTFKELFEKETRFDIEYRIKKKNGEPFCKIF